MDGLMVTHWLMLFVQHIKFNPPSRSSSSRGPPDAPLSLCARLPQTEGPAGLRRGEMGPVLNINVNLADRSAFDEKSLAFCSKTLTA